MHQTASNRKLQFVSKLRLSIKVHNSKTSPKSKVKGFTIQEQFKGEIWISNTNQGAKPQVKKIYIIRG